MNNRGPDRCTSCGAALRKEWHTQGASTTVHERDKEIILLHCPRCATLMVKVTRIPVSAR